MKVFQHYSKYYDLLYQDKNYIEEAHFTEDLLKRFATKETHSLLELGCGTGKHAYYLAQKGYDICAIDQSASMLEMAANVFMNASNEERRKVQFHQADIRYLSMNQRWDSAIALFHVMSYLTKNEDIDLAFQCVKAHVIPGGLFVFDCWYGPAVLSQLPEVRYKHYENEHLRIERVAVPTLLENENIVNVHYHLFTQEKGTAFFAKTEETHSMRYFFLPEIEALCSKWGMKLLSHGEWLTKQPLSKASWGAYFVVLV